MVIKIKFQGTVRRIDELGRIVIPKEFRRLLKIRNGEEIEMNVENDQIIIQKHSLFNDYFSIIEVISNVLLTDLNKKVIFTDLDKILLTSGFSKKEFKTESLDLDIISKTNDEIIEIFKNKFNFNNIIIREIKYYSDIVGLFIIESSTNFLESDIKLIDMVTHFLCKYVEK